MATGTGQVLFRVAPFFKQSLGTDISQTMIDSAKGKADNQVQLIKTDCLDPLEQFARFNLVTVAEALHWFPVQNFIQHAAKNLLTADGKLVVIGYYRKGILSSSEKPLGDVYKEYFSTIEECTKFDQSDLLNEYPEPKYNFKTHFSKV